MCAFIHPPTHLFSTKQEFTQSGGVRPFGLSLLVAGYDDNGPQLFQVDPSGAYFGWKATVRPLHPPTHPPIPSIQQRIQTASFSPTHPPNSTQAIGKNHVNAKNFLEKRYNEEMELDDAVHTALLTLREGFEGYVLLPTNQPIQNPQHLVRTASISSTFLSTTHPSTHPPTRTER